jgi:hypothetical protein
MEMQAYYILDHYLVQILVGLWGLGAIWHSGSYISEYLSFDEFAPEMLKTKEKLGSLLVAIFFPPFGIVSGLAVILASPFFVLAGMFLGICYLFKLDPNNFC